MVGRVEKWWGRGGVFGRGGGDEDGGTGRLRALTEGEEMDGGRGGGAEDLCSGGGWTRGGEGGRGGGVEGDDRLLTVSAMGREASGGRGGKSLVVFSAPLGGAAEGEKKEVMVELVVFLLVFSRFVISASIFAFTSFSASLLSSSGTTLM